MHASREVIPIDRHYQLLATGHDTWIVQARRVESSPGGRPIDLLFSVATPMTAPDLVVWLTGRVAPERLNRLNLPPSHGG